MKPWELTRIENKKLFDSFLSPLWSKFYTCDFYYAAVYEDSISSVVVYITPGEYFEKTGTMYADSMPITHLLPLYLTEVFISIYKTAANIDYVKADMTGKGFINNWKFQEFIVRQDWYSKLNIVGEL